MNKRVFLLVAFFITCSSITYFLVRPNPKRQADRALAYLEREMYTKAGEELGALGTKSVPTKLYMGYLEQNRGRFERAGHHLQGAYNEAKRMGDQRLLAEVLMASAVNAYFEGQDQEIG